MNIPTTLPDAVAVVGSFGRKVRPVRERTVGVLRQPSILDVVHAVKSVAAAHPDVTAWWYTPPQRLRLAGSLPASESAALSIEVVVEGLVGEARCEQVARELSTALSGAVVGVRIHRGEREERPLFRIVSQRSRSSASESARPA